MQCVILAAGEGKRMRPLTHAVPKPLLPVAGKPIIEHVLDALPEEIRELIIVIGYKGDLIRGHLGEEYAGRRVQYVYQETQSGTAHALALARPFLTGRFMILLGDDIHGADALAEAAEHPLAVLAASSDEPQNFGVVERATNGSLLSIEEKPLRPKSNLVSTGAMVLDERIFDYDPVEHENGEYYIPDQLAGLARDVPIKVVTQRTWIPLAYPDDILRAEAILAHMSEARAPSG